MDSPRPILTKTEVTEPQGFWARHSFLLLIIVTIFISLILVSVSLVIYNVSGASQLDLSRPGYQSVSDQINREETSSAFGSSGPVDATVLRDFSELFSDEADRATAVDAFNGDPLSPEVLYSTD